MNIELLKKEFMEILTLEERAEHFYSHYIDQIEDEDVKKTLTSIRDDEKIHVQIAKKLIEYVS